VACSGEGLCDGHAVITTCTELVVQYKSNSARLAGVIEKANDSAGRHEVLPFVNCLSRTVPELSGHEHDPV